MTLPLHEAICRARLATRLKQAELASRIGLKGQALSHWESRKTVPSKKHCKALTHAIAAVDVEAAAELARAVNDPSVASVPPQPDSVSVADALGVVIVELSDALDLPPRRVRAIVVHLLTHLETAGLSMETARRELEAGAGGVELDAARGRKPWLKLVE
jgi:transcriptional regulator with XRE-family HTH domain